MKAIYSKLVISVIASSVFSSCVKKNDAPTAEDNFLNYKIEEVPVTQDYIVGAFYSTFATFNANVKDTPVTGKYNMPAGVISPAVITQQTSAAARGGVDYFIFPFRSVSRDVNNFRFDSTAIKSFIDANTANMKFAMAYNWSTGSYGVATNTPLEADAVKQEQFFQDFLKVVPYLKNTNYMKVKGKLLLYILNAQVIFSNNNAAIYSTLRQRMSAQGVELYIVGMQDRWTPPARYPFRYINCVDAIYHQSFSSQITEWDRFYLLPQMMDQNWKYAVKYWKDNNWNVDYVPCISPAYNEKINTPAGTQPTYARTDNGLLYKQLCNVAKMNANETTRLILIDSWNDWSLGTQLEPAASYTDAYLNYTKAEFKKQ